MVQGIWCGIELIALPISRTCRENDLRNWRKRGSEIKVDVATLLPVRSLGHGDRPTVNSFILCLY